MPLLFLNVCIFVFNFFYSTFAFFFVLVISNAEEMSMI